MKQNLVYAKHFYNLGLNITCITPYLNEFNIASSNDYKAPSHEWEFLAAKRQLLEELSLYDWKNAIGLGTVLGYENLFALDIDGCVDFEFIKENILNVLGLDENYEWVMKTGSGSGFHILFYTDDKLSDKKNLSFYPRVDKSWRNVSMKHYFLKLEFLFNRHLVLPPSLHSSGLNYEFINGVPKEAPSIVYSSESKIYKLQEELCSSLAAISEWKYDNLFENEVKKEDYLNLPEDIKNVLAKHLNIESLDTEKRKRSDSVFLVLDIETNGLPEKKDNQKVKYPDLVQISWLLLDARGFLVKKQAYLIKEEGLRYNNTEKIHGITEEKSFLLGKDIKLVLSELLKDCNEVHYIVSHNLKFDISCLLEKLKHYSLNFNILLSKKPICTMVYTTSHMSKQGAKFVSLEALYRSIYSKHLFSLHNAVYDSIVLTHCFNYYSDKYLKIQDNVDEYKDIRAFLNYSK
jgi:DNA polymerase III epsilon subunit-like protein